jgi:hypothetical protein
MRKFSASEPGSPSADQLQRLHELVAAVLPHARAWLVAQRPSARFASID